MNNYEIENLQVASDIDHIRLRAGMYVGDLSHPYQLFNESIDNSVDEFLYNSSISPIEVRVDTEYCFYSIRDYGRGIPIGNIKLPNGDEVPSLVALTTKSFSSGKFDNDAYTYKSGLHGVGLKCINALSSYFHIKTFRDGKSLEVTSRQGEIVQVNTSITNEPNGVLIEFSPDPEIFSSEYIPDDLLINRVKTLRAFGVKINLYIDNNLQDLGDSTLESLLPTDSEVYFNIPLEVESSDQKMIVRLNYNNLTSDRIFGYTNLIHNRDGGTHVRLIRKSIQNVWKKFYPKDTILVPSDSLVGLDCLVAVFLPSTLFTGQVKDKLGVPNSELSELMDKFESSLYKFLSNNSDIVEGLLKRFTNYRSSQLNLMDQKSILEIIKIDKSVKSTGKVTRKSVVQSLLECTSDTVDGTELYLVEGKSAGGPAGRVRDRRYQAILPLRGKINNTTSMTTIEALKCQMVENIVNSTGCGFGDYIDIDSCRYEKIIILADADADGKHITALLISLFVNHLPELVKSGKLFILYPPLFGWTEGKLKKFSSNMDDIPTKLKESKSYTRFKGLGEMDDDEFYESCLNKDNQVLVQVEYPHDINSFNKILGSSSGKRELLEDLNILINVKER